MVTQNQGVRRGLALALVLTALALAVPRLLTHAPYARLGVTLIPDQTRDLARVDRVIGPPAQGLLKSGDVLIAVDGEPLTLRGIRLGRQGPLPRGDITLDFQRGGQPMRVVLPPVHLSAWLRLRVLLVPLTAVVAAPLVAFVLVWRRPDLGAAWLFLLFANLQAISAVHQIYRYPDIEPSGLFKSYLVLYGWLTCWTPAAFMHFMTVFPRSRWRAGEVWRSPWAWLVAAGYLVPFYFVWQQVAHGSINRQQFEVFDTVAVLIGVVCLVERYGRRAGADWRPSRSQRTLAMLVALLLLIGSATGWALENETFAAYLQYPYVRLLLTAITFGMLFMPFVMAFLIARDPAFDPRKILERGIPYALLTGVVAGLYLAIVVMGQRMFAEITGERAPVINVVAALLVAFAFAPLRVRVQGVLDRLFRRDPAALRAALDQAGRELLQVMDRDGARASVEAALQRGLGRTVSLVWPESGPPRLAAGEVMPPHAEGAVENLLAQAGLRLENLQLHEQRVAAERRAMELREAATRAELRALQAQVQPHFLFNALNALSYLTETDPPAAQRFTERLADMLRYTVEAGSRSSTLLSDEIAFVEDYLGVARERYEGDLGFTYRGARDLLSASVPPLLLQPLVENSLKHGLSPGARGLCLSLDARTEDGWLTLTFQDDGTANGNGSHGLGVGLENLEQRVHRFAGAESSMHAGPRPGGGYAVTMRWRVETETPR